MEDSSSDEEEVGSRRRLGSTSLKEVVQHRAENKAAVKTRASKSVLISESFRRLLVASEASKGGSFSDPGSDHDD